MFSVSPEPLDVVEAGGRPWSRSLRVAVAVAAVLILVAGVAIHRSQRSDASRAAGPPRPPATVALSFSASPVRVVVPFSPGGRSCGAQDGHHTQVGFQLVSNINTVVSIVNVRLRIPGASLRQVAVSTDECGPAAERAGLPFDIAAGGIRWVTVTVALSGRCPESKNVQVDVGYNSPQQSGRFRLSPFPDFDDQLLGCVQPPTHKQSDQGRPA